MPNEAGRKDSQSWGLGSRFMGCRFRVWGLGLHHNQDKGLGFRVWGVGFRV